MAPSPVKRHRRNYVSASIPRTTPPPLLDPKSCEESVARRASGNSAKLRVDAKKSKFRSVSRVNICSLAKLTGAISLMSLGATERGASSEVRRIFGPLAPIPAWDRSSSAIFFASKVESSVSKALACVLVFKQAICEGRASLLPFVGASGSAGGPAGYRSPREGAAQRSNRPVRERRARISATEEPLQGEVPLSPHPSPQISPR